MRPCDRLPPIPYPFYPVYPHCCSFHLCWCFRKCCPHQYCPISYRKAMNFHDCLLFSFQLCCAIISYLIWISNAWCASWKLKPVQLHYHQCYLKVQCWLATVTLTFLTQAVTRQMHKAAQQRMLLMAVTCDRVGKWLLVGFCRWRGSSYSWVSRSLTMLLHIGSSTLFNLNPGRGVGHSRKGVGE